MRAKYAFTALILFPIVFFIDIESTYSQEPVGEDERIIISVDSVERVDSFPERLKSKPILGFTTTYKRPAPGNDYLFIHFIKIDKPAKFSEAFLIDEKDKIHPASQETLTFVMGEENIKGYIIFEIPKVATPVLLKYYYQNEDESSGLQQIIIGQ